MLLAFRERTGCALTYRRLVRLLLVLLVSAFLTSGTRSRAQDSSSNNGPSWIGKGEPIEVLSDTKGFNIKPYVKEVAARVKAVWFPLIPNTVRAPIMDQGHVSIQFRLMKDGHIEGVKYCETSGNESLDRAAYGALKGASPLPPLPVELGPFVELRFHFYYNESSGEVEDRAKGSRCVTAEVEPAEEAPGKVTLIEKPSLIVSPGSIQLAPGAKTRFYAKTYGLVNSAVTWSVQGSGCEGVACGLISPEGSYTAPDKIPNPPTVTVIATSKVTPTNSASATVAIAARDHAP